MIKLITEIIDKFGPRAAASDAEDKAQDFIKEKLDALCSETHKEKFPIAPKSMFGALKIYCWMLYVSIGLYWLYIPLGFAISLIGAFLFIAVFLGFRSWLDFLYSKSESSNVTGIIEPKEKARSTLIFAGHIDSAYEFIWWYRLKNFAMALNITGGVVIIFFPVFMLVAMILDFSYDSLPSFLNYIWIAFAVLAPATIVYHNILGKRVVPGASDNLSGIAVALEVGKKLLSEAEKGNSILRHTRIKLVSFGSEEPGLKGSRAYVLKHHAELKKEKAVLINLDGIKDKDALAIIYRELLSGASYDKEIVELLKNEFINEGIPPALNLLPIGATDGASFSKRKLRAATIIGTTNKKLDPTYHTRLDLPEYIEPEALDKLVNILVNFSKTWDNKQ